MNEHGPNGSEHQGGVDVAVRMAEIHGARVRNVSVEPVKEIVETPEEPEVEKLTWEHFDDRAKDIVNELERHAGAENPEAGFNSVMRAYVLPTKETEEDPPELIKFSKLMA